MTVCRDRAADFVTSNGSRVLCPSELLSPQYFPIFENQWSPLPTAHCSLDRAGSPTLETPGPRVSSKHTGRRKSDQCWALWRRQSLWRGVATDTDLPTAPADLTAHRWPHKLIHPLTLGSGVPVPVISVDKVFSGPRMAWRSLSLSSQVSCRLRSYCCHQPLPRVVSHIRAVTDWIQALMGPLSHSRPLLPKRSFSQQGPQLDLRLVRFVGLPCG